MRCTVWAALAVLAMGCGSSEETAPRPTQSRQWHVEPGESVPDDDMIVATVNGSNVYASCVKTQAKAHGIGRDDAVQECIDFELLAQAAQRAEHQKNSDVQLVAKRELARRFIEDNYGVRSAADLPEDLVRRLWDRVQARKYNYAELRDIVFCRVPLTREQGPDSPEFKAGQAFLTSVFEELQLQHGLVKEDLFELCWEPHFEEAGVHELKLHTFALRPKSGYLPVFRELVFDPEEVGVVVRPVYSQFGLDLILIVNIVPARTTVFEEVEDELRTALFETPIYESSRDAVFESWYATFTEKRTISVFPDRIPQSASIAGGAMPGAPTP